MSGRVKRAPPRLLDASESLGELQRRVRGELHRLAQQRGMSTLELDELLHVLVEEEQNLARFLAAADGDVQAAVEGVCRCAGWRSDHSLYRYTDPSFLQSTVLPPIRHLLQKGLFYWHGHDRQGRPIGYRLQLHGN